MQLLLVSVCLAILSSTLTSASEPHYVITVPATSIQGSLEKACVTFLDLKGVANFRLELQNDGQVQVVAEHKVDTRDYSHCYPFQVPVMEEDLSIWLFHVSVHGEHINVNETKKILLLKGPDVCIIQTDKSTYKPGDAVKFRLITVDMDFRATNKKYAMVELMDPHSNRIGQWLNVSSNHGIADFTFHLANEIDLGQYTINIPDGCIKLFSVSEYVRKRFELNINLPSIVSLTDKSFNLDICGSYTYGKPVQGSFDLTICQERYGYISEWRLQDSSSEEDSNEKCIKINRVKTDSKGCLSREIDLSFFNFSSSNCNQALQMSSSLMEFGTGHIEKASANIYLSNYKNMYFVDTGEFYHQGIPFHGKVNVVNDKKQPMVNQAISLHVNVNGDHEYQISNLVTDQNGIVHFTLNTSTWEHFVQLTATFLSDSDDDDEDGQNCRYSEASIWMTQFYSESDNFLTVESISSKILCDSNQSVTVEYYINKNSLDPESDHLTFFYYILSKGRITSYKTHQLEIKEQASSPTLHGSFPIKYHVDADLYPVVTVFVFSVLPKGETIANRATYKVTACLKNKVQLKFSEEQVIPGEKVNLKVTAEPGSLCSVRSVDKGFLLQMPHDDPLISTDFELRLIYSLRDYRDRYQSSIKDPVTPQCQGNQTYVNLQFFILTDVYTLFEMSNLQVFTDTRIKKPVKCVTLNEDVSVRSSSRKKKVDAQGKDQELKHFTRGYFPDTWLYELFSVGEEGHTVLNLTTPDTITKWETDAFCLGNAGFGEVKDVGLTTFQPYFIDLIVPYSVVQRENFTIQALVFSYVKKCMLVVVLLSDSEDFATVQNKEQVKCICEGQSSHFTWDAIVLKTKNLQIHVDSRSLQVEGECSDNSVLLGMDHREDSIEKTILVKPMGHEEQKTETFLLCTADNSQKVQVSLHVPDRLVPGSERAHIILLGDLMDNIVINLDNILNMPEGCGEQNIAKFSRYVYTLQYLHSIKELTPQIKENAVEALIQGYQRQLTFKHENGSYGLFAGSKPNLWLTSLVVKAFNSAQDFLYIDEKNIQQSVRWLHSQQLPNGCFKEEGSYFNNELEVDNEVARAAYIIISLLEHPLVYNGSIVENALSCIRNATGDVLSVYTKALLAYAFTLSGDDELRQKILKSLDEDAVKTGGNKHWEANSYGQGDVEITAYVLLALLSDKTTTLRHLEESADIVRWIMKQQNPWGGFRSSQDTAVALHALFKYAKATYHKKGDSTVTIESKLGFHKEIHVDQTKRLLLQTVDLPEIPGEYTVTATGNGCVYLQSHLHYNILPVKSDAHFALSVSTTPYVCAHEAQNMFEVHLDVRYSGRRNNTNMAVIVVELLSGFLSDKQSIGKLKKNPVVKRTDVSAEQITIYLHKLTHENEHITVAMKQETNVENLQPANILVYDYYDPVEHTLSEYNSPCIGVKGHCAVDVSKRKDCGYSGVTRKECEEKGCCFNSSVYASKWCFFQEFEKEEFH